MCDSYQYYVTFYRTEIPQPWPLQILPPPLSKDNAAQKAVFEHGNVVGDN